MENPFKTHGAFSWSELVTSDPEAAKHFYGEIFGWEMEDMAMPGMTYTVVKAGGEAVGGIMSTPPESTGAPPNWGNYVTVDDVDATVEKALSMKATLVMPPMDIPEVGRMAVIQDPQGAVISVITYVEMSG